MTMPPQGTPPQGPSHFTPPPAEPVSASSARRNLIIAGVLAGGGCLLVVIVIIALVIVVALRGGGSGGGGTGGEESDAASVPLEEQATTLVTDYFDALSAGDAATALELRPVDDPQGSTPLPIEAYDAALEAAPVAAVEVGTPVIDEDGLAEGEVPVTFTVGDRTVEDSFHVHDYDDDGELELTSAGATETVPEDFDGLAATLNGVELTAGDPLVLLPGAYELVFGAEHFQPSSTDPLIVGEQTTSLEWPDTALSDEGLTAFRGAVQGAVDQCIAATSLEAGCGMSPLSGTSTDGWAAKDGTVSRTLTDEAQSAIDEMEAELVGGDPSAVEGSGSIGTVPTTLECTKDGQSGECEMIAGGTITVPTVDMTDPELPVTWS